MAATLNEANERIYQTFATGWGATSPYEFDNNVRRSDEPFPPVNGNWARLTVRHNGRVKDCLGKDHWESSGSVFIQCFAPLNAGRAGADNLATIARDIFEGKTLAPEAIRFTAAIVREIGPDDGWYQINVEALFTYTETR